MISVVKEIKLGNGTESNPGTKSLQLKESLLSWSILGSGKTRDKPKNRFIVSHEEM